MKLLKRSNASIREDPQEYELKGKLIRSYISHSRKPTTSIQQKVKRFIIPTQYYEVTADIDLRAKMLALRYHKIIRGLQIKFGEKITDYGMKILRESIRRFPRLRAFKFGFEKSNKFLSDKGFRQLSRGIQVFRSLRHFSFSFGKLKINEQAWYYIVSQIRPLTSLNSLEICFPSESNIRERGLHYMIDASEYLRSLSNLSISVTKAADLRIDALRSIMDSLKSTPNLKSLQLNFSGSFEIDQDVGFKTISERLSQLKNIRKLILNTSAWQDYTHEGMKALADSIKNLKFLNTLELRLSSLRELEDNEVAMREQPELKKALECLSQAISPLTNLQYLSIGFSGSYYGLNDEALELLSRSFENVYSLSSLELSFDKPEIGPAKITDNGFMKMARLISSLDCLLKLSIRFVGYDKITDKSLKCLEETMASMPLLHCLNLELSSCSVSNDAVTAFHRGLTAYIKFNYS